MCQSSSLNTDVLQNDKQSTTAKLTIRSMPDPEDIYSSTLGAADVSNSSVHVPHIRTGDGDIIAPEEYDTKLEDGTIVMVTAYLKLYMS